VSGPGLPVGSPHASEHAWLPRPRR
jgi:hypothetical protein